MKGAIQRPGVAGRADRLQHRLHPTRKLRLGLQPVPHLRGEAVVDEEDVERRSGPVTECPRGCQMLDHRLVQRGIEAVPRAPAVSRRSPRRGGAGEAPATCRAQRRARSRRRRRRGAPAAPPRRSSRRAPRRSASRPPPPAARPRSRTAVGSGSGRAAGTRGLRRPLRRDEGGCGVSREDRRIGGAAARAARGSTK